MDSIVENHNTREAALHYAELGFSVIPVGHNKVPLIPWKEFQTRIASKEEIEKWFMQFPSANVGMITGAISGIVAVDIEKGGEIKGLPPTAMSKTGGGGWHFLYKHPSHPVKDAVRIRELTDIRGDGGFIVVAPSLHQSGNRYEWIIPPDDKNFEELPEWVLKELGQSDAPKTDWNEFLKTKNTEGSRNNNAAQYAGKLVHELSPELWESVAWPGLLKWHNENNTKSTDKRKDFSEKELRSVFDSIARKEFTEKKEPQNEFKMEKSQSLEIIKLVTENDTVCFCDEHKIPHVRILVGDHKETWTISSRQFRDWLSKKFYDRNKKTVSGSTVDTAIDVLNGMARFDGPTHQLNTRAVQIGDSVWYDLCDEKWRAVHIDPKGWSIESDVPEIFRRYNHQGSQVMPAIGGNLKDVLRFINVQDEDQKLLFLVSLVSFFIPGYPHPIPYIYGPQGSAKSTLSKIVRMLVDPSILEVVSMPRREEEMAQALAHNYMLFFDNVGVISDQQSDLLCKAITGSGFSKRQLYTDDEDIIYSIRTNIGINGIELVPGKPDLLERSILFELNRVNPQDRRQEHEMMEEFEKIRPSLLGAIFTAVSKTLATYKTVKTKKLPRMADFARIGCAIAEAIGYSQEEFLDAYLRNISQQNDAVLDEHAEASLLVEFMADKELWEGTTTELLGYLKEIGGQNADLPKRANAFSSKLTSLKTNIEEAGLKITRSKGTKRILSITKIQKESTAITQPKIAETVQTEKTHNGKLFEVKDRADDFDNW